MTFEPHPREYFATLNRRPELAPTRISGLRDKLQALAAAGIEQVVVERFDARLAEMSANAFIEDLLVAGLQTRWLLVGEDFRYGHKRSGDVDLLREASLTHGFEVCTLADITDRQGHRISSSEVRTAWRWATWTAPRNCWASRSISAAMSSMARNWAANWASRP